MADDVKVSKVGGLGKGIAKLAKEIKSELKKVIWPNRKQLTNNTLTVLACCLIVGLIIWALDYGLGRASTAIFMR